MSSFIRILLILPLFVIVLSLLINTEWEVSHELDIDAPPAVVWSLLADLSTYPQWNRYSPKVSGTLAVGEEVWVEAHLDDEVRQVQNFVLSIKPEQELCWGSAGWFRWLANGVRCRWLTPNEAGGTHLVHHEVMQGPLAWLVQLIYQDRIERGIQLVNESVAGRAESGMLPDERQLPPRSLSRFGLMSSIDGLGGSPTVGHGQPSW